MMATRRCTPVGLVSVMTSAETNWIPDANQSVSAALPTDQDTNLTLFDGMTMGQPAVVNRTMTSLDVAEDVIYRVVIVAVCALGLICNIFNLIVLSRKSLTGTMERLERSAHYGLTGLAVSDVLFCVAVLPKAYVGQRSFGFNKFDFRIVYLTYGNCIVNTFILSSTWLTVTMAVSRYVAICYPLQARQIIGQSFTSTSICSVFLTSIVANIPRYFQLEIGNVDCLEGGSYYFVDLGRLSAWPRVELIYQWTYFVFGIIVPFVVLVFCNVNFVAALRRSMNMRFATTSTSCRVRGGSRAASVERSSCSSENVAANRITLTLVIIVLMFFWLVMPSEVMTFMRQVVITNPTEYLKVYHLVLAIANALQAVNFSFNFLLYCAVNAHFRQTVIRLVYYVLCCRHRLEALNSTSSATCRRRSTLPMYKGAMYHKASQSAVTSDDQFGSMTSMTAAMTSPQLPIGNWMPMSASVTSSTVARNHEASTSLRFSRNSTSSTSGGHQRKIVRRATTAALMASEK